MHKLVETGLRFGMVGAGATLLYVAVTLWLMSPAVGMPIGLASAIGFGIALLASYVGHALFTFRVGHSHFHYGPRFILSTLVLSASLSALAEIAVDHRLLGAQAATLAIAVIYPVASFIVHQFWSFVPSTQDQSALASMPTKPDTRIYPQ
jgi:putative flippase GtrA